MCISQQKETLFSVVGKVQTSGGVRKDVPVSISPFSLTVVQIYICSVKLTEEGRKDVYLHVITLLQSTLVKASRIQTDPT